MRKHSMVVGIVSESSVKPHVAVLTCPGVGHIVPLLELSKRLVIHHGFHVSFLNITTTNASAAQTALLHSPTLPSALHVIDLPPPPTDLSPEFQGFHRFSVMIDQSLRCLKSVLIELPQPKPKALIVDLFCTQAFEVCKQLSIPAYTFFTPSAAFCAFSLYLPKLDRDVEGEFSHLPEPVQVPGCSPVRTEDLLDQVCNRKNDDYKWLIFHLSRLPMAAGMFLNSWKDLEPVPIRAIKENPFYQQIPTPPVHPIGPLIKEDVEPSTKVDSECLAWLDQQPPDSVIFIALGSGGTLTAEQLTEFACGVELSRQRFIWVLRKPTSSGTISNVGGDGKEDPEAYLPEGFLERTRGLGLVVPTWACQVAMLRHSSTGGFLSHCGWNSTLESMRYGVPMIAWPLYAEQKMNATMLAEEVRVAFKPVKEEGKQVIGRKEIERVVRLLMEGEEGKTMRAKAKQLKQSAVHAMKTGGSSYDSLSRVAQQLKHLPI